MFILLFLLPIVTANPSLVRVEDRLWMNPCALRERLLSFFSSACVEMDDGRNHADVVVHVAHADALLCRVTMPSSREGVESSRPRCLPFGVDLLVVLLCTHQKAKKRWNQEQSCKGPQNKSFFFKLVEVVMMCRTWHTRVLTHGSLWRSGSTRCQSYGFQPSLLCNKRAYCLKRGRRGGCSSNVYEYPHLRNVRQGLFLPFTFTRRS